MRVIEIALNIHWLELSAILGDGMAHLFRARSADTKFPAGWVRVKGFASHLQMRVFLRTVRCDGAGLWTRFRFVETDRSLNK